MKKMDDIDLDIMNFKQDKLSFYLLMIFIVLNTILTMNSSQTMEQTIRLFSYCMFNIILTLLVFLAAEKIKNYNIKWSYVTICIGVIQLLRLIVMPQNTMSISNVVMYIITGLAAVIAGLLSAYKCKLRQKFIERQRV